MALLTRSIIFSKHPLPKSIIFGTRARLRGNSLVCLSLHEFPCRKQYSNVNKLCDHLTKNNVHLSQKLFLSRRQSTDNNSQNDRVLTIPNLLCVGRIAVCPYLVHTISNGDLKTSLAIFGLASFSDLVSDSSWTLQTKLHSVLGVQLGFSQKFLIVKKLIIKLC